ncbi:MAG: hypothetical protein ACKN9S_03150, partial [Pirellula sp.]
PAARRREKTTHRVAVNLALVDDFREIIYVGRVRLRRSWAGLDGIDLIGVWPSTPSTLSILSAVNAVNLVNTVNPVKTLPPPGGGRKPLIELRSL